MKYLPIGFHAVNLLTDIFCRDTEGLWGKRVSLFALTVFGLSWSRSGSSLVFHKAVPTTPTEASRSVMSCPTWVLGNQV